MSSHPRRGKLAREIDWVVSGMRLRFRDRKRRIIAWWNKHSEHGFGLIFRNMTADLEYTLGPIVKSSSDANDEEETQEPAARAVTRLESRRARVLRIVLWRPLRPLIRFQRRHPTLSAMVVILCLLGAGGGITTYFINSHEQAEAARRAAAAADTAGAEAPAPAFGLQYGGIRSQRREIARALAIERHPSEIWKDATEAFVQGDFLAAEADYRLISTSGAQRPVVLFRILLCLLGQKRVVEAMTMQSDFNTKMLAISPAPYFAKAVIADLEGREEEAKKLIEQANIAFPLKSVDFTTALREYQEAVSGP